jgi:hypothetical protein
MNTVAAGATGAMNDNGDLWGALIAGCILYGVLAVVLVQIVVSW